MTKSKIKSKDDLQFFTEDSKMLHSGWLPLFPDNISIFTKLIITSPIVKLAYCRNQLNLLSCLKFITNTGSFSCGNTSSIIEEVNFEEIIKQIKVYSTVVNEIEFIGKLEFILEFNTISIGTDVVDTPNIFLDDKCPQTNSCGI